MPRVSSRCVMRVLLILIILNFFCIPLSRAGVANLSWTAPTTNADGTLLSDLAGYKIYYGTSSGNYTASRDVGNTTSYQLANLTDGYTYYFAVTAYDISRNESVYSNEATKTLSWSDSGGGGGCFIATAAYGSYLEPDVMVLRGFRDRYLLTNEPGRALVSFYYRTSPPIADFIARHGSLKLATRLVLTPLVYGIKYPWIMALIILNTMLGLTILRRRIYGGRKSADYENLR